MYALVITNAITFPNQKTQFFLTKHLQCKTIPRICVCACTDSCIIDRSTSRWNGLPVSGGPDALRLTQPSGVVDRHGTCSSRDVLLLQVCRLKNDSL